MNTVEIELHNDDGEVTHRVTMPAEPTDVDGLAVTPMVGAGDGSEPRWLGYWGVTHAASGRRVGGWLCLACARRLARQLGRMDLDWTLRQPADDDDPRARQAAGACQTARFHCLYMPCDQMAEPTDDTTEEAA